MPMPLACRGLFKNFSFKFLCRVTKEHHFGFEATAWYWHFVDVVWLFLFIFWPPPFKADLPKAWVE